MQNVASYINTIKVLEELQKYLELLKVRGFIMDKDQAIRDIEFIESKLKDFYDVSITS